MSPAPSVWTSGPEPYLAVAPTVRLVCGDSLRSLIGFFDCSLALPLPLLVDSALPAAFFAFFLSGFSSSDETASDSSDSVC